MASKEEVVAAITQGISDAEATFGNLSDQQLATQVHFESPQGWTAGQVLAHLAGRAPVYALMQNAGTAENPFAQGMTINDFNDAQVQERSGKSRDELLTEFRTVHEGLAAQVQQLDNAALAQVINLGPRSAPLGEMLAGSGGRHSSAHAKEVTEALAGGGKNA